MNISEVNDVFEEPLYQRIAQLLVRRSQHLVDCCEQPIELGEVAFRGAFRDVIGEPEWRGFEAVSDLAWIAEAGIPGLLYGPGDTMQAHSTAEYVDVEELVAATKVVALALVNWCQAAEQPGG